MDNTTIQKFLDEHDYDIRKTHNGRWIDQKCTMDVVCLVSDCIVEYTSNREDKRFTVNKILKIRVLTMYIHMREKRRKDGKYYRHKT